MKVLTVRQPWAWLICAGHKDIENRTWPTRYRGPLLIQASAKAPTRYDRDCAAAYARERGIEIPDALTYGGIVGMVQLVDCVRSHQSPWFIGPVGWVLTRQVELPFVPLIGRLGLFDAPEGFVIGPQQRP